MRQGQQDNWREYIAGDSRGETENGDSHGQDSCAERASCAYATSKAIPSYEGKVGESWLI